MAQQESGDSQPALSRQPDSAVAPSSAAARQSSDALPADQRLARSASDSAATVLSPAPSLRRWLSAGSASWGRLSPDVPANMPQAAYRAKGPASGDRDHVSPDSSLQPINMHNSSSSSVRGASVVLQPSMQRHPPSEPLASMQRQPPLQLNFNQEELERQEEEEEEQQQQRYAGTPAATAPSQTPSPAWPSSMPAATTPPPAADKALPACAGGSPEAVAAHGAPAFNTSAAQAATAATAVAPANTQPQDRMYDAANSMPIGSSSSDDSKHSSKIGSGCKRGGGYVLLPAWLGVMAAAAVAGVMLWWRRRRTAEGREGLDDEVDDEMGELRGAGGLDAELARMDAELAAMDQEMAMMDDDEAGHPSSTSPKPPPHTRGPSHNPATAAADRAGAPKAAVAASGVATAAMAPPLSVAPIIDDINVHDIPDDAVELDEDALAEVEAELAALEAEEVNAAAGAA